MVNSYKISLSNRVFIKDCFTRNKKATTILDSCFYIITLLLFASIFSEFSTLYIGIDMYVLAAAKQIGQYAYERQPIPSVSSILIENKM